MNRPLDSVRSILHFVPRLLTRRLSTLPAGEIESIVGRLPAAPIPRVLHQIWLGPKRPPLETMASCRLMNPDWQYVLWTEDNLPPMINRRLFDGFGGSYEGQADVLRYEVLFRFGGVYVDADQLCLRGFGDLVGGAAFFAGYQHFGNPELDDEERSNRLVANAVIGAAARHPIIERIIHSIADAPVDPRQPPWQSVGPVAVTRVLERIDGVPAVIHPFHGFYPYHYTERIPATPDRMLKAIHYRSHSVSLWGTTLGRYRRWRRMPHVEPGWAPERFVVPADFAAAHPILEPTVYGEGRRPRVAKQGEPRP